MTPDDLTPNELIAEYNHAYDCQEGAAIKLEALEDDIAQQQQVYEEMEEVLIATKHEWLKSHRCVCGLVGLVCKCPGQAGGEA